MSPALIGIVEDGRRHVVDWQDEVAAVERLFSCMKSCYLAFAVTAFEEIWCDNHEQQGRRVKGLVDALLPVSTPFNVIAVLEDSELMAGLHANLAAEPLA